VDYSEDLHEAALAALSRRALSVAELRTRLARRKHPKAQVEMCLRKLAAAGLVDDRRLAYNFALGCAQHGRRGPARVRAALLARGVPAAVADAAVAEAFPPSARQEALERAARRLVGPRGVPEDRRGRERLIRQLRRSGFSFAEVLALLERHGLSADELPALAEDDEHAVE